MPKSVAPSEPIQKRSLRMQSSGRRRMRSCPPHGHPVSGDEAYNCRMHARSNAVFAAMCGLLCTALAAQWLNLPSPGIPRTPDGKPNLTAPAPKTADGKPDISGLWQPQGLYIGNIGKDLKPEDIPLQPWAKALYDQRRE